MSLSGREEHTHKCQFTGVVAETSWSIEVHGGVMIMDRMCQQGVEDGFHDIDTNDEAFLGWVVSKVEWGKVEGTRLLELFMKFGQEISIDQTSQENDG